MVESMHPVPIRTYLGAVLFGAILTAFVLFLAEFIEPFVSTGFLLTIIWGITFLRALVAWIVVRFKKVEIGDHEIKVKTGVFNTKIILVPYDRITNVGVKRSFLERIFGLGTLEIDTAGTPYPEAIMANLPYKGLEMILEKTKGRMVKHL